MLNIKQWFNLKKKKMADSLREFKIVDCPLYLGTSTVGEFEDWVRSTFDDGFLTSTCRHECVRATYITHYALQVCRANGYDGICFRRKPEEWQSLKSGDVDYVFDTIGGNLRFNGCLTVLRTSPHHFKTCPLEHDSVREWKCIIFSSDEARQLCYTNIHPAMKLVFISRLVYTNQW